MNSVSSFRLYALAATVVAGPFASHAALIGHYSFENDSGGSIYNDATSSFDGVNGNSTSPNSHGTAKVVDGDNTYRHWQTLAESSNLDYISIDPKLSGLGALSFSIWINTSEAGVDQRIAGSQYFITGLGLNGIADGQFRATFNLGGTGGSGGSWRSDALLSNTTTLNDGEWHMITLTYEAGATSSTAKLYVDGVLDNTSVSASTGNISEAPIEFIGGTYYHSDNFQGDMDEVRYYNSVLELADVTALFDSTKGQFGIIPEPATSGFLIGLSALSLVGSRRRSK